MKRLNKRLVTIMILVLMLAVTAIPVSAASMKLSKKSTTLKIGQSVTLQVKGSKRKAKWTSSNKKVAAVNQKGKITAKNAGKATITAKIGKKKLTCKVTVKKDSGNKQTIYYKGQKTENGITYHVVVDSNRNMRIDITNHTTNTICMGWVHDFYITVTTNRGEYPIIIKTMQSLANTGKTDNREIVSGDTVSLRGLNPVMTGVPQEVTVHNVYPLDESGMPIRKMDWPDDLCYRLKTIMYSTTILVS